MDGLRLFRQEVSALWAEGKGKVLISIAIGWGLLNGTRMIYPVLLPYLSADFNLTFTTAGLLVTLIWLGYAIGQVPGGILADQRGERKMLTGSVVIVSGGLTLVVLARTPLVLFTATGLIGLGLSLYPVARITALSDLYPDRIGRALGLTMATGDIGQTLLPPIAGALAAIFAWQVGLGFVIPLLILMIGILWITLPVSSRTDNTVDDISVENAKYVLTELYNPTLVIIIVILFLYLGVLQTFSAFYPTYLIEVKGLSSTAASGLFGLFFAIGVLAKPLAGLAYDRIGIRRSLPLVLSGAIIGFALLPIVKGLLSLILVTVFISTMLGSGTITQSYLSDTIPENIQGTGLGTVRSTSSMMGAIGPVLFGAAADRGYFDEGYVLLAIIVGLITILTFRLPQK